VADLACASVRKLKRGWLQVSPGREGETPREGKAHEGHGQGFGLIHRPEERTLAGSKALKCGLSPMGLRQIKCRLNKVSTSGGRWKRTGWRSNQELGNRRRAKASERAYGSAGGRNPGG
jgi:hypothetical protein